MNYTYTIYDADPATSSGTSWPSHEGLTIEADSDEEALERVHDVMRGEAAGLDPRDGYDVGDLLYALVWAVDGSVDTVTYELSVEDLGAEVDARIYTTLDRGRHDARVRVCLATGADLFGDRSTERHERHPALEDNAGVTLIDISGDLDDGGAYGCTLSCACELVDATPAELRAACIRAYPGAADWEWGAVAEEESDKI